MNTNCFEAVTGLIYYLYYFAFCVYFYNINWPQRGNTYYFTKAGLGNIDQVWGIF